MPVEQKAQLARDVLAAQKRLKRFIPLPGPQTEAYLSKADILLYGGQAAGGKTFLTVGLFAQEHQSSIIFRREASQTDGLERAGKVLIQDDARFNGQDLEWTWPDGRTLKLSGMKEAGDWNKHAGRERDAIGFDEAGEFLLEQVSSMLGWLRGPEGQRCRMILGSNPPRTADGAWLLEWFAPWLDPVFPEPATPGELRWAFMIDGKPQWCEAGATIEQEGELLMPVSLTFIPASLKDNPYRNTPEYRAKLNSLPEPLRSQLMKGEFTFGGNDDPWQAIPTEWVKQAMARWTPNPPQGVPMCAIGVDVAQGGADKTIAIDRYDSWFAQPLVIPGVQTPGGAQVAGLVVGRRRDNAKVILDIGGGWGGDAFATLRENGIDTLGYMGVKESHKRTRDGQLYFTNIRTEAYWRLREALDPEQPGGSAICLPPDKELLADLCSPRYSVEKQGIKLESKESVVKKLGRSPDKGDAVVMAWFDGDRIAGQKDGKFRNRKQVSVNLGPRQAARKRYG